MCNFYNILGEISTGIRCMIYIVYIYLLSQTYFAILSGVHEDTFGEILDGDSKTCVCVSH